MELQVNVASDNPERAKEILKDFKCDARFEFLPLDKDIGRPSIFLIEKYTQEIAAITAASGGRVFLFEHGKDIIWTAVDKLIKDYGVFDTVKKAHEISEKIRYLSNVEINDVVFYLKVENDQFRFVEINPAFSKATGLMREQVVGKLVNEVIPEPSLSMVLGKYQLAISERKTIKWEEITKYATGEKYGEVSVTPVTDSEGIITHLIGTVHDVTERKDYEKSLQQSIFARDEFLSIAAHELKTPLTPLLLELNLATRIVERPEFGMNDFDLIKEKIRRSLAQTRRLRHLVTSLLDITNITSGKLELHKTDVDLIKIIHASGERTQIEEDFLFRSDENIIGRWDKNALETIMTNLLANAKKFGGNKPIKVEVNQTETNVQIKVIDQGIGMNENERLRVFQKFERAVSSRHFGGFGLGLWVTRELVLAHNGTINVQSSPGLGSTFTISIPKK